MVEEGAVYLLANVNLESFDGFVPVELTVFYESPESRDRVNEAIKEHLDESIDFADLEETRHGYFALALPSVARVRQIQNWVRGYKRVERVHMEILNDIVLLDDFMTNKW